MATQAERLARIEAIVERMEAKLDKLEGEQVKDIQELKNLKSKGSGILIGVALFAAGLGAGIDNILNMLFK